MTDRKKEAAPDKEPPGPDLHAGDLPEAEDQRKRGAEHEVVESVAGAMAGEVIAAVTGKGKKRRD
jgi:hypothetical protein